MPYDPEHHHRNSIRLKNYDYRQAGAYFLTLCTHQRECLFGNISAGVMQLNPIGQIVQRHWLSLPRYHPHVTLDAFVVMPDHFHGLIVLQDSVIEHRAGIPEIIRGFKTFSARQINRFRQTRGIPVWQRNYYDRIVRDRAALERIRTYIITNPEKWQNPTPP